MSVALSRPSATYRGNNNREIFSTGSAIFKDRKQSGFDIILQVPTKIGREAAEWLDKYKFQICWNQFYQHLPHGCWWRLLRRQGSWLGLYSSPRNAVYYAQVRHLSYHIDSSQFQSSNAHTSTVHCRRELVRLMTTSFNGHPTECAKTGITLYVKAFRISTDASTAQLPYMWSVDGEPFKGMATLQAEVHPEGYPLLALPRVSRNRINHAPDFD